MDKIEIRANDGKWHLMRSLDSLMSAIFALGPKDTLEIRKRCLHNDTWVESGIKTCKDCGRQLEVTSFRD